MGEWSDDFTYQIILQSIFMTKKHQMMCIFSLKFGKIKAYLPKYFSENKLRETRYFYGVLSYTYWHFRLEGLLI